MQNQRGFTLIELLAVIIILGIIFSVAINKFGLFEGSATQRMIDVGIKELNTREKLVWSNVKLRGGYDVDKIDEIIQAEIDRDLGNGTDVSCSSNTECVINVQGYTAAVERVPADRAKPALWSRE